MTAKYEYGDYQTPLDFAERVCRYLKDARGVKPTAVVEPTCGVGAFLQSALIFDAKEYYGIEINPKYCDICRQRVADPRVRVVNADAFSFSTKSLIKDDSRVLVIGNPPWVTNSGLSAIGSGNLPEKANIKGLKGLDALTGESNFDVCEFIITRLINEYRDTNAIVAMLCKTSVARNVFKELKRNEISFESCDILEFDALKVFDVNASACVLFVRLANRAKSPDYCDVRDFECPETVKCRFGFSNGRFFSKLNADAEDFDGRCCFEWRQGVKHDCSKVMELTLLNGEYQNGLNKTAPIEDDFVFPLIKSSMFKSPVIRNFSKYVIVTQKRIREGTKRLETEAPKTWKYLNDHIEFFENRKSSIYRDAPLFSMFGVGDYSYSKYKVGVSGFYKHPLFSLLYSEDGKPVMTDDTSYFICFDDRDLAYVAMLLLNSAKVQRFLESIAFLDAKRPYTKKILDRIDFDKIVDSLTMDELIQTERELDLPQRANPSMYDGFKSVLRKDRLPFF
ncbi:MAG: class I SAM-dependent methyltransferase [Thermoguttaceae bacterium]|nr:class I SAM-dependent methyltransferase [Thermoguttaceae bacterium]